MGLHTEQLSLNKERGGIPPSPRREGGTPTGSARESEEREIEEAIWLIASRFGENPDKAARFVDQFGAPACIRALDKVQELEARGKRLDSPFGYMVSLLRGGTVQTELAREAAEERTVGIRTDWLRERYERAQADPRQDTAAKRLARVKLTGELVELAAR